LGGLACAAFEVAGVQAGPFPGHSLAQVLHTLKQILLVEVWFDLRRGGQICLARITQPKPRLNLSCIASAGLYSSNHHLESTAIKIAFVGHSWSVPCQTSMRLSLQILYGSIPDPLRLMSQNENPDLRTRFSKLALRHRSFCVNYLRVVITR
jgi:hypothetical protein